MANFLSNLFYSFNKDKYPQLLIIGTQKAGTTTLFDMLNCCPNFCGSSDKETGFFTKDVFYNQGNEWYLMQFEQCNSNAIKFEATPEYLYYPDTPKKIYSFNKRMKFIVVLREPAARCYSAWNMFRSFNENSAEHIYNQFTQYANPPLREAISDLLFTEHFPSFKQAVFDDIERYQSKSNDWEPSFVRRGLYCEQIENYLQYFRLSEFLFLEQRELNHPDLVLKKISNFLDIEIDTTAIENPVISNTGAYEAHDESLDETMFMLKSFYKPFNDRLFSQIGIEYDWNEQ
ncbi:MAG: sulfotransferase domain-containing protein [Methylococcaceae bacterium]|nr:sulfotransferase domain-containing protein [Methylococcaceae bacterium]